MAGQGRPDTKPAGLVAENSNSTTVDREQAAVAKVENEWLSALTSANVDAIAGILADDFVRPAPDYGNFVGKKELLSFYRSHLHPNSSQKKRIENMKVTIYGSTALARGTLVTTNAEGALVSRLLFTDVFVKRDGRWQAVSAQENAVTAGSPPAH